MSFWDAFKQPSWEDIQEARRRERRRAIADGVLPSLIEAGCKPEEAAEKAYAIADAMMREEAR